ncbi:MAG TPA: hypothetical protein VFI24_00695 [Pyrinomonadaceae bacterium]|nr:hypothetical protein [Pyrinomonadaceae bacterium]
MSRLLLMPLSFTRNLAATFLWLGMFSLTVYAQGPFVSGSTGTDGPFNPTESQTLLLPESGVFNFTTINIPQNVTIRFARNARNTPVTILATGNVTIAGAIDISGSPGNASGGGLGGPGGFNGGSGGIGGVTTPSSAGVNGDGPGAGAGGPISSVQGGIGTGGGGGFATPGLPGRNSFENAVNGDGGSKYGLSTLVPLIGGSGGGGEGGRGVTGGSTSGSGGGGGGGALLIASSGSIIFPDPDPGGTRLLANGGFGGTTLIGAGGGSGGAIRLIANRITGNLRFAADGGSGGSFGGPGGAGYLRIESFDLTSLNLIRVAFGQIAPRVTLGTPGVVIPANAPSIRIVSVAGITPPSQPNGSLQGAPDIILPANQANPVSVALAASNIPLGSTLQVTLTPENGARINVQGTALTGTVASSTATASVSLPDGISVIQASGTIDVAALAMVINGERIKSIEVTAVYGGKQTLTYITASNKRIKVDQ